MKDGVLENPKVDMTLSLHLWNEKPLGWIHVAKGPVMAGAEEFKVKIIGKGGHGAIPEATIDPIVCAAQIVSAAQTIVSRNVSPHGNRSRQLYDHQRRHGVQRHPAGSDDGRHHPHLRAASSGKSRAAASKKL